MRSINNQPHKPVNSFNRIAKADARVLILGSIPGIKSLEAQQYYAHPQNRFWRLMAHFFAIDLGQDYITRLSQLQNHGIALWDVVHQCVRPGSLDSAIDSKSVISNDFATLFNDCPNINAVFFNGQKAAALFKQKAQPLLDCETTQNIHWHTLPSSSPANAAYRLDSLIEHWASIKVHLVTINQ